MSAAPIMAPVTSAVAATLATTALSLGMAPDQHNCLLVRRRRDRGVRLPSPGTPNVLRLLRRWGVTTATTIDAATAIHAAPASTTALVSPIPRVPAGSLDASIGER